MIALFRPGYGAGPLHLIGLTSSFALAGWAVLTYVDGRDAVRFGLWFVGAILFHDVVLYPLYSAADRALQVVERGGLEGPPAVPFINHVRIPALLSGLLLIVYFPLVLSLSTAKFPAAAGYTAADYLTRWLVISGVLFAGSGLIYAARRLRARSSEKAGRR